MTTVIDATSQFKAGMGSKEERATQVVIIREAMETFMQAAIDLTDALAFDFDAEDDNTTEDDDPDSEHDGAEQEQGEACAHYRMDQTIPTACQFYGQTVHPDTVL